jgi:hypothetical protein
MTTRIRLVLCEPCERKLRLNDGTLLKIASVLCGECAGKTAQAIRILAAGGVILWERT